MKKNVVLTSLAVIAVSCPAFAETDVTFAGDYKYNNATANVTSAPASATYSYEKSDGTTATERAYSADITKSDFTYTDKAGVQKSLADGTPVQADYVGTSTASGDISSGSQEIVAGATADRSNYTYKNGQGETVTLGTAAQDMVSTLELSGYATGIITVTNGSADGDLDGVMYSFTSEGTGETYHLSSDGTQLVDSRNMTQTPEVGSVEATKFEEMKAQYGADKATLAGLKSDTAGQWTTEQANFAAAEAVFSADSNLIDTLSERFATVGIATNLYDSALANQQAASTADAAQRAAYDAAKAVYDAPILDTITNGANDAIDGAMANGGVIRVELDSLDSAISDEATAREEADTAIRGEFAAADAQTLSDAKDYADTQVAALENGAVATNATNIAANATAISDEATAREEADTAIRSDVATNANAIATINDTMGTIHGLISEESSAARQTTNGKEYKGNLAIGTTVEDHLLALDNAIGDRDTLDGEHVTSGADVVTNLQSLNDGIEAETAARIAGDDAIRNEFAAAEANTLHQANAYTDEKVNTLEKNISGGVAAATALSSVAVSGVSKGEVSVGGGYGYYNSQSAVALGAAMGLTDNWSVNAGAGIATGDKTQVSFRAGTNYKFKLF